MTPEQLRRLQLALDETQQRMLAMATELNNLVDAMLALQRQVDALKQQSTRQNWRSQRWHT